MDLQLHVYQLKILIRIVKVRKAAASIPEAHVWVWAKYFWIIAMWVFAGSSKMKQQYTKKKKNYYVQKFVELHGKTGLQHYPKKMKELGALQT